MLVPVEKGGKNETDSKLPRKYTHSHLIFALQEKNQVSINPIALRMAKTLWSFGPSECNRVNASILILLFHVYIVIMYSLCD